MVRRDQHRAAPLHHRVDGAAKLLIDGLAGGDGRIQITGMADHVRVGEVADENLTAGVEDGLDQPVADFGR